MVLIGYGAGDAFGTRGWAFAAGLAAFKALLAVAYVRERRRPYARDLVRTCGALYALQAVLWASSLAVAGSLRLGPWIAALVIDFVTPFLVAPHSHGVPPHPEHLPERFGLFTIILLGESVAAAIHGLDHAARLRLESMVVVVATPADPLPGPRGARHATLREASGRTRVTVSRASSHSASSSCSSVSMSTA